MFHNLISCLIEAKEREHGQGLVEYALILLIVSIAAVGTMAILGTSVSSLVQQAGDAFP